MTKCLNFKCQEEGRLLGKLSDMELVYCQRHEKYGKRVIDFLIMSTEGNKLNNLMHETRVDILRDNKPELCNSCGSKITSYIHTKAHELYELDAEVINNGK